MQGMGVAVNSSSRDLQAPNQQTSLIFCLSLVGLYLPRTKVVTLRKQAHVHHLISQLAKLGAETFSLTLALGQLCGNPWLGDTLGVASGFLAA